MTKAELINDWDRAYKALRELNHDAFHAHYHTNDERFKKVYDAISDMLWNLPIIKSKDRKAEIEQKVNEIFESWDKANKLLHETLDAYYLELARKR